MDTHISLDVLFFILALLILPSTRYLVPPPGTEPISPRPPTSGRYLAVPGHSGRSTPAASPLPSPSFASLAVPSITFTPDRPAHRPSHKRKSVSFSISSIDNLPVEIGNMQAHRKRPPTPFIAAQPSPAGSISSRASPAPSLPGSPMEMDQLSHSRAVIDPMGVQKSWLLS